MLSITILNDILLFHTQVTDTTNKSPLRKGNRLISINNQQTRRMSDIEIKRALKEPTLVLVIERYIVTNQLTRMHTLLKMICCGSKL